MCNVECELWKLARKKAATMKLTLPPFCPRAQSGECPADGPHCVEIEDDPYQSTVAGAAQNFQLSRVEGQAKVRRFMQRASPQS